MKALLNESPEELLGGAFLNLCGKVWTCKMTVVNTRDELGGGRQKLGGYVDQCSVFV